MFIGLPIDETFESNTRRQQLSICTIRPPTECPRLEAAEKSPRIFLGKELDTFTTYVVILHTPVGGNMAEPKLSKLELQIMETLWTRNSASIREIQENFPEKDRPAYTTIQTTVYRLESKKAVRRLNKKIGNFHIFEAAVSRDMAQRKLIDD